MKEVQEKYFLSIYLIRFKNEFDETSSHSFRTPNDMQYSLTYFSYIMEAKENITFKEFWDSRIDTDHNGFLLFNNFY